ncbi:MAG: hypothetical protein A3H91_11650 [Gammaproteobacteria bacterium RIFCSPLOWO2_02_FULL_61_13]|nr:MAG: hypothetical protein A3H91_11650 [Gammaproteobacteria bacterium RIFCSPLOWO2_02_FULL_61_13]
MPLKTREPAGIDPGYSDTEFNERLRLCSVEQLEQCIRLLGMYLALYKRGHGELDESAYAELLNQDPVDLKLAELMSDGMDEANAMLLLIQSEPGAPDLSAAEARNKLN